jgi:hypothetical protein
MTGGRGRTLLRVGNKIYFITFGKLVIVLYSDFGNPFDNNRNRYTLHINAI